MLHSHMTTTTFNSVTQHIDGKKEVFSSQFHQHFTKAFFVRKQIEPFFSNFVWLCNFLAQKARVKC